MAVNARQIILAFRLLSWMFPARPLADVTSLSEEELKEKYKWWHRIGSVVAVLVMLTCATAISVAAIFWADAHYQRLGKVVFIIRPSAGELVVWSAFISLACGGAIAFLLLRLVMGRKKYAEYIAWQSITMSPAGQDIKVHVGKMLGFLLIVVGFPLAVLMILRIDQYTAFTERETIVSPFRTYGQEKVRPYSTIRGIYAVRGLHARFEDVVKPFHAILFADGTLWKTDDGMRAPRPQTDIEFIDRIALACGLPVQQVNFIEDIPH